MLLPPSVSEWLPADHVARFVISVVESLDLSAIYGAYRADGHGRPAHDPAVMTALLLYDYAVGVRSSRAIERRCVEDVACRVIAASRAPDHATIARFRVQHQDALSGLLFEVLALCRDAGMVQVGRVAVDSTRLAANASTAANRTHDELREEAARILGEAAAIDVREDAQFGERRGDELPDELAEAIGRPARIRELWTAPAGTPRRSRRSVRRCMRATASRAPRPAGLPGDVRRAGSRRASSATC